MFLRAIFLKGFKEAILVSNPFVAGQCSSADDADKYRVGVPVSNPFVAGQCSSENGTMPAQGEIGVSPTPSLRGNVPQLAPTSASQPKASLQPLRCGAMFLSSAVSARGVGGRVVSNPFVAGQCSSGPAVRAARAGTLCLQPLRCGAMFLSTGSSRSAAISSSPTPSLRGNVPQGLWCLTRTTGRMSPTPSLRGNVPQSGCTGRSD